MNPQFATELLKALMLQAVAIATPILLTAMVIGLAVSLFQSVTSIQEQTLTFVPKIAAILVGLILLGRFLLDSIVGYTHRLFSMISNI